MIPLRIVSMEILNFRLECGKNNLFLVSRLPAQEGITFFQICVEDTIKAPSLILKEHKICCCFFVFQSDVF